MNKYKFNTYVINLKKDKIKLKIIQNNLNNVNMPFILFNAINGRGQSSKVLQENITDSCNIFCPNAVIGCGLSHILLTKHFYNNDPNNFALILEDDAKPLYKNIQYKIMECVENMGNKKWDIIK